MTRWSRALFGPAVAAVVAGLLVAVAGVPYGTGCDPFGVWAVQLLRFVVQWLPAPIPLLVSVCRTAGENPVYMTLCWRLHGRVSTWGAPFPFFFFFFFFFFSIA